MQTPSLNEKLLQLPARPLTTAETREIACALVISQNCDTFIFGRYAMMHLAGDEQGAATWRSLAAAVQSIKSASRV